MAETILWRRLDRPGHESARLSLRGSSFRLEGGAVFAHDGMACRLDYTVVCDPGWRTSKAMVTGWLGESVVSVEVRAESGRWWSNDVEVPAVKGAVDVDLNFSPSTNLLPIRRLRLNVGEAASVRAAWLRFPGFELEPLDQSYRRIRPGVYGYESATGFAAELEVDPSGFVTFYPELCRVEAMAREESGS